MQFHISRDGQQYGPYDIADMRQLIADGNIQMTDQVWIQSVQWHQLTELETMLGAAPTPGVVKLPHPIPQRGVGVTAGPVRPRSGFLQQPGTGFATAAQGALAAAAVFDGVQHMRVASELHRVSQQLDQSQRQFDDTLAEIDPSHTSALSASELVDADSGGGLFDLLGDLFG